jgi:hypothetical protein
VIAVGSFTGAAAVNYRTLAALGEVPVQADFSRDGTAALVECVRGRLTRTLLARLAGLDPARRAALARQAEADMLSLTGQALKLDKAHPSAPLLISADRSVMAFTLDGYGLFGLRSNRTQTAVGHVIPTGSGWASADESGQPRTPRQDAAKELSEEFGLEGDIHDLGYNFHDNTLGPRVLATDSPEQFLPGVVPAFSYCSYCRLDFPLADVLPRIRLNDENLGVVAIPFASFDALAQGETIRTPVFYSEAEAARMILAAAGMGKTTPIAAIRAAALSPGAPRLAEARYAVDCTRGYMLELDAASLTAVGRDYVNEGALVMEKLGEPLTPALMARVDTVKLISC